MDPFLRRTDVIDWDHPAVEALARSLAGRPDDIIGTARRCFEWVRDQIPHTHDHGLSQVTCAASEVLRERTGYCYAKSHLLAALLRANGIPAGLTYQRLSLDDVGPPFCLHGLNAVKLPDVGWYRIDARGNRSGIDAQFTPPIERLAFAARLPGERDLPEVLCDPLQEVVAALRQYPTAASLHAHLPDVATVPPPAASPLKPRGPA
jgi:transglutaminase-like putative cysteine protease